MIVIDSNKRTWENCGFTEESQLDALLLEHPEILLNTLYEEDLVDTILPLAGGDNHQFKNIDALFLAYRRDPNGRDAEDPILIVVENKLAKNTQGRNYVVGQVIAYAASLAAMSNEDLAAALRQHLPQHLHRDTPESKVDEIIKASVKALDAGRMHMVVCVEGRDGEHHKLRENIAYLNKLITRDEDVLRHIRADRFLPPGAKCEDEAVQALYLAAALEQARARDEVPGEPPEDWASIAVAARTLARNEELVAHLLRVHPGPRSMCVAESVSASADTKPGQSTKSTASIAELRSRLSPELQEFCNQIERASGMTLRSGGSWLLVCLEFGAESSQDDDQRKPLKVLSIVPGKDTDKPARIRIHGRSMRKRNMPHIADWYGKQAVERRVVQSTKPWHDFDKGKAGDVLQLLGDLKTQIDEALAS